MAYDDDEFLEDDMEEGYGDESELDHFADGDSYDYDDEDYVSFDDLEEDEEDEDYYEMDDE